MASPPLSSPTFWRDNAGSLGTLQSDGSLLYVVLDHSTEMRIIQRTTTSTMTSFLGGATAGLKVVVNGNMFDATGGAMWSAKWGTPDDPSKTTPLGKLFNKGSYLAGKSSPSMFYFAQITLPPGPYPGGGGPLSFLTGFGDPGGPDVKAAVGGVGPLIISGRGYGTANVFAPGAPGSPPPTGEPPVGDMPYLRQRSNATFASVESRPASTGKAILASCFAERKLLVIVQPHGVAGTSYTDIRDKLAKLWVDQAAFLDGSDSVFLWVAGRFVANPATYKDDLDTIAIGFT
jgi:hypothetical protein